MSSFEQAIEARDTLSDYMNSRNPLKAWSSRRWGSIGLERLEGDQETAKWGVLFGAIAAPEEVQEYEEKFGDGLRRTPSNPDFIRAMSILVKAEMHDIDIRFTKIAQPVAQNI